MNIIELPINHLTEATWNPNQMDSAMLSRLKDSISRFGLVGNLVVRPLPEGLYEVLSGNQRLQALGELGYSSVPCLVVELDDSQSRLLAQALNRVQGEDDLGLKAELLRRVLTDHTQEEVLSIIPETAESLQTLASLGETDMAQHLKVWQAAQAARLRHLTFQLVPSQLEVVEEALERALAGATKDDENPTRRGNALFYLCKEYLESHKETL